MSGNKDKQSKKSMKHITICMWGWYLPQQKVRHIRTDNWP